MTIAAAIDLGSNAVRMTIASRHKRGRQRVILQQRASIRLGHDVFTEGKVREETIQALCQAFSQFYKQMRRHQVQQARAVATSAMREAKNGDAVLRRLAKACPVPVEIISGVEEAELIRQAVQKRLDLSGRKPNLLVELGGGSAELSLVQQNELRFSECLKIGAVRLLEVLGGPEGGRRFDQLVEQYCGRVLRRIKEHFPPKQVRRLIGTGGNIEEIAQLAVKLARAKRDKKRGVVRVKAKAFDKVYAELSALSPEGRMKKLGLRKDRADVIEPAAVFYRELMRTLRFKEIWVPFATLREGILENLFEKHLPGQFPPELLEQIHSAALQYAKRFKLEMSHARQVCRLSLSLFDQLLPLHHLGGEQRLLLELAAFLHDIGYYIGADSHHKHSLYLIGLMDFPGLSKTQVQKVALVARYHRRSHPKMEHRLYADLSPRDREEVRKLASILRMADALDRAHKNLVRQVQVQRREGVVELLCQSHGDLVLERWALQQKGELFTETFGKRLTFRTTK